jgi:anaerobic selenocysteine-containing dehydrogenase
MGGRTCKAADVVVPYLEWKERDGPSSSGVYRHSTMRNMTGHIVLRAGSDVHDQKLVLLHELAHHLAPRKDHHSLKFWKIAMRLYKRYGVNPEEALRRESGYRKKAVTAFEQVFRSKKHLAEQHKTPKFDYEQLDAERILVRHDGIEIGYIYREEKPYRQWSRREYRYIDTTKVEWYLLYANGRKVWMWSRKRAAALLLSNYRDKERGL